MNRLLIAAVFCLSACSFEMSSKNAGAPKENPGDYKCSPQQSEAANKYFEACNKSSYVSSYCFLWGLKNFCEKVIENE